MQFRMDAYLEAFAAEVNRPDEAIDLSRAALVPALAGLPGAVLVDDFEELVDAVLFFRQCRRNVDRRVAVIGGGGAVGVAAGDICERVGLVVPPAPVELQQQFSQRVQRRSQREKQCQQASLKSDQTPNREALWKLAVELPPAAQIDATR